MPLILTQYLPLPSMNRFPIPYLFIGSLLAMFLLIGIQWYLVSTTFKYEQDNFEENFTAAVEEILEPYNPTDIGLDSIFDFTEQLAKDYKSREKYTGKDFIETFLKKAKSKTIYEEYLRNQLPKKGFDVSFEQATFLTYLGLNEDGQSLNTFVFDTILMDNKIEGSLNSLDFAFPVHHFIHSREDYLLGFEVLVKVEDSKGIVLEKMWLVLGLAIFSIAAIIAIFLFTLRALIRQKRLSDLKTDFINNITHEFKTPLATINLAGKNLKNPKIQARSESINELSDMIERQNKRLQSLIDQALQSSLSANNLQLKLESLPIHEFLNNKLKDFESGLKIEGAEMKTVFLEEEIYWEIDPFHFTTVFFNILDNAVKYAQGAPKITIKTALQNQYFLLTIQDEGIGMDLKKHDSVFSKFYRIPTGNLHNVKGLGLGLFYVKKIVEAHGGKIRIESEEGRGTTVFIYLKK